MMPDEQQSYTPTLAENNNSTPPTSQQLQPPPPTQQQPHQPHQWTPHSVLQSPPRFRRLFMRQREFQVGVAGFLLAACVFIVGYSAPAWASSLGLWLNCRSSGNCGSNVGSGPGWFDAVRAMESLALVCFVAGVALLVYEEVYRFPPPEERKAVEILGILAAVLGLIGVAIFGDKAQGRRSVDYYGNYYYGSVKLNWAYGLTAASCILVLLSAILIAHSRVAHAAQTQLAVAQSVATIPARHPPAQPFMSPYAMPMYPMQTPCVAGCHLHSPCYHPYPGMTAQAAPTWGQPPVPTPAAGTGTGTSEQGASQIPMFFVMVQGQALPVYDHHPSVADSSSPAS